MRRTTFALLVLTLGLPAAAHAQTPDSMAAHVTVVQAATLKWAPLEVAGFAPGLMMSIVHGDPATADQPYTIRLKFPDGYAFPAHLHPNAENLTVLSGTFMLGHGTQSSETGLQTYTAGDYLHIPGGRPHYGKVQGETLIQLHGMGPFSVEVVEKPKS